MIARLRQLTNSSFARAVAILSSGQGIAMLLPILAAPILGRLYRPEDYGVLATYMATAAVVTTFSSLQLQHAIVTEKLEAAAREVVYVILLTSVGVAILATLFITLFWRSNLSLSATNMWFMFIPVSIVFSGFLFGSIGLANRNARYHWISKLVVTKAVLTVSLSIAFGFAGWRGDGLMLAYLAGQSLEFLIGTVFLISHGMLGNFPTLSRLKYRMIRKRKFPIYSMPSEFISALTTQGPVFLLGAFAGDTLLGEFSRARQLMSIPISLIGGSIAQVFFQRASLDVHETGTCFPIFVRTFWVLLGICLPTFTIAFFVLPYLFVILLGPNWAGAGIIAQILAPMILLRFINSPLSSIYLIFERQKEDLYISIGFFGATFMSMVFGHFVMQGHIFLIVSYSAAMSLCYVSVLAYSYKIAKTFNNPKEIEKL